MAFFRRGIGDSGSSYLSTALLKTLRWSAIPCLGIALAFWSVATLAGLHSAASLAYSGTITLSPLSIEGQLRQLPRQAKPTVNARKMLIAPVEKSVRLATLSSTQAKPKTVPAARPPADPFGKVVLDANLSREKLLAAFARAGVAIEMASAEASEVEPVDVALAMPSAERFHRTAIETALADSDAAVKSADAELDPLSSAALGRIGLHAELDYAAVEAPANNTVQLALASLAVDPYGTDGDEAGTGEDYMPDAVEMPPAKPDAKPGREPADTAGEPARKPVQTAEPEPQQTLAYARPDKPEGSVGRAFRNLFNNTPKAGNKVAIYDISAAVVHMPDGSKLEAHSGIGKMADNPRYVHVKMKGPTPPNTYKLSMREKRFHGVEAIRMTPIGGQTMHGRDGMLAHTYLLRGGREESHGCVAFENYPRFLKAFKQGKITHMIVVPSISRSQLRLVSNGRGA
jgi:hypothetical protein